MTAYILTSCLIIGLIFFVIGMILVFCQYENKNIFNKPAENAYKSFRRLIVYNTHLNSVICQIEGFFEIQELSFMSILAVISQIGEKQFKTDYIKLNEDISYSIIELDSKGIAPYYYDISNLVI